MKLTENFTLEELCATSHTEFQAKNLEYGIQKQGTLLELARLLEKVRRLLGDKPIKINSAVRCHELNELVGGSSTSQHLSCQAADFTPTNMSLEKAVDLLRKYLDNWGQIILERSGDKEWIHISLGVPFRNKKDCKQVLKYDGKKYIKI